MCLEDFACFPFLFGYQFSGQIQTDSMILLYIPQFNTCQCVGCGTKAGDVCFASYIEGVIHDGG